MSGHIFFLSGSARVDKPYESVYYIIELRFSLLYRGLLGLYLCVVLLFFFVILLSVWERVKRPPFAMYVLAFCFFRVLQSLKTRAYEREPAFFLFKRFRPSKPKWSTCFVFICIGCMYIKIKSKRNIELWEPSLLLDFSWTVKYMNLFIAFVILFTYLNLNVPWSGSYGRLVTHISLSSVRTRRTRVTHVFLLSPTVAYHPNVGGVLLYFRV